MARRILLIDDEEVLARNIKRYLDRRGFDTAIAVTGRDGLQRFAKGDIDLVLLDINLPDLHGLMVLEEIRRCDPQVNIVCISGSGSEQIMVDAIEAGAHAFVEKPVRLGELKALVETALNKPRLERTYSSDQHATGLETAGEVQPVSNHIISSQ